MTSATTGDSTSDTYTEDPVALACMVSLVGSLADNKGALGRRYAEWGVSAPTLESAVAAAAMAQDEMGHARSTYPVLKALGVDDAGDEGVEGRGNRLALLDAELPDWSAFIAANLLVDGILTTFVAACVDSTLTPLAQRARKILQEEGSHRAHAEAWARRLVHTDGAERDGFIQRLHETWEDAGRWGGPPAERGYDAVVAAGLVSTTAAEQREQVRSWLTELLGAQGVAIELTEFSDWTGWDPRRRRWDP